MVPVMNKLGCVALRYTCRIPSRRKLNPLPVRFRPFHPSPPFRRDARDESEVPPAPKPYDFQTSLDPDTRAHYDSLSPEDKVQFREGARKLDEYMTSPEVESTLSAEVSQALKDVSLEAPKIDMTTVFDKVKVGLMGMGEADEQESGEDEEFEGDDISSLAHGELEQHREMREYARIAAWEMPLLSSAQSLKLSPSAHSKLTLLPSELAKPFIPPSLDQPLRFRYTNYMGETHPAAKKIVLEFCTRDLLDLNQAQRIKLIKLVGVRYNPETDIVKMSSEMFETQAQNKRYLGDLVDTLVAEAKDTDDMYEDVPLDFRHHKYKPKIEFPTAWKLTTARKMQLEADSQQKALADKEREEIGQLPDGVQLIESRMAETPVIPAMMAAMGKGKGKGQKRRVMPLR